MTDRRTSLYRHYDADDKLLYIGVSLCQPKRLDQHKRTSDWFWEIAKITIEHFDTLEEAKAAERDAIRAENPSRNKRWNRRVLVQTVVRLSPKVMAEIDAIAGKGNRAKFIRSAVKAELERREAKLRRPAAKAAADPLR